MVPPREFGRASLLSCEACTSVGGGSRHGNAPRRRGFVSDIFTEVDEEVRREQLKKLWERYGNYVVAAVILVIAAVAAWRGYDYWQTRKAAGTGAGYHSAAPPPRERKARETRGAFPQDAAARPPRFRGPGALRQGRQIAPAGS